MCKEIKHWFEKRNDYSLL